MKDHTKEQLEASRPNIELLEGLNFCLDRLYADQDTKLSDRVVKGMSFEELIGVLLMARDAAQPIDLDDE